MNDKLSLNCSGTERWGGEGKARRVEGGSAERGGISLSVMDKGMGEHVNFQSRVDSMVGEGGVHLW